MKTFKVIVAGGRTFDDFRLLCSFLDRVLVEKAKTHKVIIVSGCARGADQLGERYAKERGYGCILMPADWETNGNAAGFIRNAEMAKEGCALVAFFDGSSKGTKGMIDLALRKHLITRICKYFNPI